jgi:HK97 gp10 family phage protein
MISVQVTGMAQLHKRMVTLGPKIALKALRGALVSGAQEIKKDAIQRAPMLTGRLKRAVLIKSMPKGNPFNERVIVGVRHGKKMQKRGLDAFYWGFIEFGHKDRSGKQVQAKSFIRPAFESKKVNAMDRISSYLKKKISQFVKEPA